LPRHAHEDYQFCLSLDFPGEYRYRGSSCGVPLGSLSIIHPGEMHSARDPKDRCKTANHRLMYVGPDLLREAASEVAGRATGEPFFPPSSSTANSSGVLRLHASLGRMPADDLMSAWKTNLYAEKPSHHMRTNHRVSLQGTRPRSSPRATP
jgi:hypothetical protein